MEKRNQKRCSSKLFFLQIQFEYNAPKLTAPNDLIGWRRWDGNGTEIEGIEIEGTPKPAADRNFEEFNKCNANDRRH